MPSQLVAYSGFSATNYIQEPYSADLDFGTGEWSVWAWVSAPASSTLPVATVGMYPYITSELAANGDFNSGSANWSIGAADATHIVTFSGGTLRYQSDTVIPVLSATPTSLNVVTGKTYELTVVTSAWVSGSLKSDSLIDRRTGAAVVFATGAGTATFICIGSIGAMSIVRNSANVDVTLDSLSIREIGPSIIAERSAATGPSIKLGMDGAGKLVATAYDGTTRTVTTPAAYNTGVFTKARATYTAAGKLGITVNGMEVASVSGTPLLTMNNANAVLTIGNSRTLDAPFPGSITMVKLGATVPTPEQSLWMYEQEKQMFRSDAQITLPASTAVLDLSYDESQDKWTAVQAGAESSFTGLIRTATAAVSAGSFTKVDTKSGVTLLSRSTTSPGVDVTIPAYGLREELVRRGEAAAKASKTLTVFDFDAVAAQTDFQLPMGWTATEVLAAGASQREGTTKAWTRQFDGFRETVKFAVAPGAAVWVQITARKE